MHSVELGEARVDTRHRLVGGQRGKDRLIAAALHPLATGVELDLPFGELRSQANVLSVAPNCQRELVFIDYRLNGLGARIAENPRYTSRGEGELGEPLRVGRPGNDINALAAQLVDYGLDARALQSNAGAHRIDRIVA